MDTAISAAPETETETRAGGQLGRLNTSFHPAGPWGGHDYARRAEIRGWRNSAKSALVSYRATLRQMAWDLHDGEIRFFEHNVEMATRHLEWAAYCLKRRGAARIFFVWPAFLGCTNSEWSL